MTTPNEQWQVRQTRDGGRVRTLFRGAEKDVRKYVEQHFPRIHSEPGTDYGEDGPTPDVTVHAPDGSVHVHHDGEWTDKTPTAEPATTGVTVPFAPDEDDSDAHS